MFIKIQIHHNEQKIKLKVQHNFMEETKPYNIHKSKVCADFHFLVISLTEENTLIHLYLMSNNDVSDGIILLQNIFVKISLC